MAIGGDSPDARLFWAVGVPVLAAVLVAGGVLLTAPVIGVAGYAIAVLSQVRYLNVIVFFGAFLALVAGLSLVDGAATTDALRDRGQVTTCTVLAEHPVPVTSSDPEGLLQTRTRYTYDLRCADPTVTSITTDTRLADPGNRIGVLHDPAQRLDPRPVRDDEGSQWLPGLLLLGLAAGLRLLFEREVWPFRAHW